MLDCRIRRLITNIVYKKKTHYVPMQTLRERKEKKKKKKRRKDKEKIRQWRLGTF